MRRTRIIGIDIGGTKCAVSEWRDGRPLREHHRFATRGPAESLAEIARMIEQLDPSRAPLCGIACGGPLDPARGLILSPPNLPGWDRVHVTAWFTRRFGEALAMIIDTINPERIVIGSLWLRCRDLLGREMHRILRAEALPASLRAYGIVPSRLGERIGNYGAVAVALHSLGRLPPTR